MMRETEGDVGQDCIGRPPLFRHASATSFGGWRIRIYLDAKQVSLFQHPYSLPHLITNFQLYDTGSETVQRLTIFNLIVAVGFIRQ